MRHFIGMSPGVQIACSFALTHGVAMLIAVRELRSLRGTPKRPPDGDIEARPTLPLLPQAGQRPLPDCLIPVRLPPQKVRELA